jgi:hypothetical protein
MLVDVERRGVLAANELVDRLVRSVDGNRGSAAGPERVGDGADDRGSGGGGRADDPLGASAPEPDTGAPSSGREPPAAPHLGAADDLLQVWLQVVRMGLETFGRLLPPGGAGGRADGAERPTVETGGATSGIVRIEVAAGAAAPEDRPTEDPSTVEGRRRPDAEVWLHNRTRDPMAGVALHCGDLRAADGAVLPAASVRFDPAVVDLPARSSRGVGVSVDTDVPVGAFHGVVLATGIPDAWLPIEVVVVAAPRPGD